MDEQGQDPFAGGLQPLKNTYQRQFQTLDKPTEMEAYNEYDRGFIPNSGMSQEHNRANNQSSGDLLAKAVKRLAISTPLKFAESISDLGGFLTGTSAMDNPLSVGLRQAEDAWKEMNPVYRSQKYDEGTVWDKMTSGSFLANDLIDGVAYMASAWGGTKLIGAGVGMALKATMPELALAEAAMANGQQLSGGSKFVQTLLNRGLDANNITRGTVTALNTISEATAESVDSYTQVKQNLLRKKQLGLMGHSGYEDYANIGDDQIESEARSAYKETFVGNAAILILPNWLESGWWLGKAGKAGARATLTTAFRAGETQLAQEAEKMGFKHGAIAFAKGFATEGLWEENLQGALQMYEKSISDPTLSNRDRGLFPGIAGTLKNSATNLAGFSKSLLGGNIDANSEEGQGAISIWLGGALGSPMALMGHYREQVDNKKQRTELQAELDRAHQNSKILGHGFNKEINFAVDSIEKDDTGKIKKDAEGNPIIKFDIEKKTRDLISGFFKEMSANHAVLADMADNEIYGAVNTHFSAFNAAMEIEQSRWDKGIKDVFAERLVKNFEEMSKGTEAVPESKDEQGNVIPAQEAVEGTNVGRGLFKLELLNSYRDLYRNEYQAAYNKAFRSFDGNDENKKRFLLDMVQNRTIEMFRLQMLKSLRDGNGSLTTDGLAEPYIKSKQGREDIEKLIAEKEAQIEKFNLRTNSKGIEAMYGEYQKSQSVDDVQEALGNAVKEVADLTKELSATTETEVEQTTKDADGKDVVTKVKQQVGISEEKRKELNRKIQEKKNEVFLKRQEYEEQAGIHAKSISTNFYHDKDLAKDALAGKDVRGMGRYQYERLAHSRTKIGGRFSRYQNRRMGQVQDSLIAQVAANIQANREKMAGDLTLVDRVQDLMDQYEDALLNPQAGSEEIRQQLQENEEKSHLLYQEEKDLDLRYTEELKYATTSLLRNRIDKTFQKQRALLSERRELLINEYKNLEQEYKDFADDKALDIIEEMLQLITQNQRVLFQASLFDGSVIAKFMNLVETIRDKSEKAIVEYNDLIEQRDELGQKIQEGVFDKPIIEGLRELKNIDLYGIKPEYFLSTPIVKDEDEDGNEFALGFGIRQGTHIFPSNFDDVVELQKNLLKAIKAKDDALNQYKTLLSQIDEKDSLTRKYANILNGAEATAALPERAGLEEAVTKYKEHVKERSKLNLEHTKLKDYDKKAQLAIETEWLVNPNEAYFRQYLVEQNTDDVLNALSIEFSNIAAGKLFDSAFDIDDKSTWTILPDVAFTMPLVTARYFKEKLEEIVNMTKHTTEDETAKGIIEAYKKVSQIMGMGKYEITLPKALDMLNAIIAHEDNRQNINIGRMEAFEKNQKASHQEVLDIIHGSDAIKLDDSYGLFRELQAIKSSERSTKKADALKSLEAKEKAILLEVDTLIAQMGITALPSGYESMSGTTKLNALLFSLGGLSSFLSLAGGEKLNEQMRVAFKFHAFVRVLQSTGDINQTLYEISKDAKLNDTQKAQLTGLITKLTSLSPIETAQGYLNSTIGDKGKNDAKYQAFVNILTSIDKAPMDGLGYSPNYLQMNAFIESVINFDLSQKENESRVTGLKKKFNSDSFPQDVLAKEYIKDLNDRPLNASLLLGVSGSGKTIGTQLLIKYYLAAGSGNRPSETKRVLLVGHTSASSENLKNEAVRTIPAANAMTAVTNVEFYNMTPEQRSEFDLIIADEQFTLSTDEFRIFQNAGRNAYNDEGGPAVYGKDGLKILQTPVLFIMGDSSQPRGEIMNYLTDLESVKDAAYKSVKRLTPLSIGYRASVQAIESVAYQFKSSTEHVQLETTEANKTIEEFRIQDKNAIIAANDNQALKESLSIIGLISDNDADEQTRQNKILDLVTLLDNNTSTEKTVIIVANEKKKQAYIEGLVRLSPNIKPDYAKEGRIQVMTFNDVQGRTFDNVLIDYVPTDKMVQRSVVFNPATRKYEQKYTEIALADLQLAVGSEYKKNSNVYMAITRGKKFVYMNGISQAKLETDNKLQKHVFSGTKEAEALRKNYEEVKKNFGVQVNQAVTTTPIAPTPAPAASSTNTNPPPAATPPAPPVAPTPAPTNPPPTPPVSDIDNSTPIIDNTVEEDEDELTEDALADVNTDGLIEEDKQDYQDQIDHIGIAQVIAAINPDFFAEGSDKIILQHPETIEDITINDGDTHLMVKQRFRIRQGLENIHQDGIDYTVVYPAAIDSIPVEGTTIPNSITVPIFSNTNDGKRVTVQVYVPLVTKEGERERFTGRYINSGTFRYMTEGVFKSETEHLGMGLDTVLNDMNSNEMSEYTTESKYFNGTTLTQKEIDDHKKVLKDKGLDTDLLMQEMVVHEQSDMNFRNYDPTKADSDKMKSVSQTIIQVLTDLKSKDNNVNDSTLEAFISEITINENGVIRLNPKFLLDGQAKVQQKLPAMLWEISTMALVNSKSERGVNFLSSASPALKAAFGQKGRSNGIYGMPVIILKNIPIGTKNGKTTIRDFFIPLNQPKMQATSEIVSTFTSLKSNLDNFKAVLDEVVASLGSDASTASILGLDAIKGEAERIENKNGRERALANGTSHIETNNTQTNLLNTSFLNMVLYAGQDLFDLQDDTFAPKTISDADIKKVLLDSLKTSFEAAKEKIVLEIFKNQNLGKNIDELLAKDKSPEATKSKRDQLAKIKREQEDKINFPQSETNILGSQYVLLTQGIIASPAEKLQQLKNVIVPMVYGNKGSFFGTALKNKPYTVEQVAKQTGIESAAEVAGKQPSDYLAEEIIKQFLSGSDTFKQSDIGFYFNPNEGNEAMQTKNESVKFKLLEGKLPAVVYAYLNAMKDSLDGKDVNTIQLEELFNIRNKSKIKNDAAFTSYQELKDEIAKLNFKKFNFTTETTPREILEKTKGFDLKASLASKALEHFAKANYKIKDENGNEKRLLMSKQDKNNQTAEQRSKTGRQAQFNVFARLTETNFNFASRQKLVRTKLEQAVKFQSKSQFPFGMFEIVQGEWSNQGKIKKKDTYGVNDSIFRSWMNQATNPNQDLGFTPMWNTGTEVKESLLRKEQTALYLAMWRAFSDDALGLAQFVKHMEQMGDSSYSEALTDSNGTQLPVPMTEGDIQRVIDTPTNYKQSVTFGLRSNEDERTENEKKLGRDEPSELNTTSVHKALDTTQGATQEHAKNILDKLDAAFPAVPLSVTPNKLVVQRANSAQAQQTKTEEDTTATQEAPTQPTSTPEEAITNARTEANDNLANQVANDPNSTVATDEDVDPLAALKKRIEGVDSTLTGKDKNALIENAITNTLIKTFDKYPLATIQKLSNMIIERIEGKSEEVAYTNSNLSEAEDALGHSMSLVKSVALMGQALSVLDSVSDKQITGKIKVKRKDHTVAFQQQDVNEAVKAIRRRIEGDVLTYAQSVLSDFGMDIGTVKMVSRLTDATMQSAQGNKPVWGYVKHGAIALEKSATRTDFNHEFFHYTFRYLMTEPERRLLIENAKSEFGEAFKNMSFAEQEEYLANQFEKYMQFRKFSPETKEEAKAKKTFLRAMFDRFIELFNWIIGARNIVVNKALGRKANADFEAIRTGKYKIYNAAWDMLYSGRLYEAAFSNGAQLEGIEDEFSIEGATLQGLIREIFSELKDASSQDYIDYVSHVELTIGMLYAEGHRDGYVMTYHQAIGQAFNKIQKQLEDKEAIPKIFTKLESLFSKESPDKVRSKMHSIFTEVIKSLINNIDMHVDIEKDNTVDMGEGVKNVDNEKKKAEDNPTTHLRHVIKTFFRIAGSDTKGKSLIPISKEKIFRDTINQVHFADLARLDEEIEVWLTSNTLAARIIEGKKSLEFGRAILDTSENNALAIKRRIIQIRKDSSIKNSGLTDNPGLGIRTLPVNAGNMAYVYDKHKQGYGLEYTNGGFSKTYYIDGRIAGNTKASSPKQIHDQLSLDLELYLDKNPSGDREALLAMIRNQTNFNLLVRRAEADQQLKALSQTIGSLGEVKMTSDTEGFEKGQLFLRRMLNSSAVSYEDIRTTVSDSIISGIQTLLLTGPFTPEQYTANAKAFKDKIKKEALKVKGFSDSDISGELKNASTVASLVALDNLFDDMYDWMSLPENRNRFLNRNNLNQLEEAESILTDMEEAKYKGTSGNTKGEVAISFGQRIIEITKFLNSLDTETIRLTMKSMSGDMLYAFQNSTFMMDLWHDMKDTDITLDKLQSLYPFLKSKNFEHNSFNKTGVGSNHIINFSTFDAYKQTFTGSVKVHKAENEQEFLRRVINFHFLHNMAAADVSSSGTVNRLTYDQETFPLEGRARLQMANINFLNKEELKGSLNNILLQLRNREHDMIQTWVKGQPTKDKNGNWTAHVLNYLGMSKSMLLGEGVTEEQIDAFEKALTMETIANKEIPLSSVTEKLNNALAPLMEQLGRAIWQNMVKYNKTIHPQILTAARNMKSQGWMTQAELDEMVSILSPTATVGSFPTIAKYNKNKDLGTTTYFYNDISDADKVKLDGIVGKMFGAYQYNRYVNSYHLNQMIAGDLLMYGKDLDLIKRLLGTSTPGQHFQVDNTQGEQGTMKDAEYRAKLTATSPYTRAIVVSDAVMPNTRSKTKQKIEDIDEDGNPITREVEPEGFDNKRSMETTLRRILQPQDEEARNLLYTDKSQLLYKDEIEAAIKKITEAHGDKGFEITDGYCLMTQAGYENLKKGLSEAYDLGDAQKLIYFGIDEHIEQLRGVDGRAGVATPYYVKSSYLVLSPALIAQYPALNRLNQFLIAAKADELHFGSSVKVGAPKNTTSYEDILHSDDRARTLGKFGLDNANVVRMNNKYRRAVYNPIAKLDSKISLFTQMFYMQMVNTPSGEKSDTITSALAFLFEKGIERETRLMKNNFGAFIQKTIKNAPILASYDEYLNGTLDEDTIKRLMTDATIRKAVQTAIVSTITKKAINVNFKGAKLISAPAGLLDSSGSKPLTLRHEVITDEAGNKTIQYTADCIVSEGMLDAAQKAFLDGDKDYHQSGIDKNSGINIDGHKVYFEKGDFLSMRLPTTGKHSGVVLRVVGYHKSPANIVFVAPESSKILGEDYDVDARFTVFRETWKGKDGFEMSYNIGGIETKLKVDNFQPIGYIKKKIGYRKQVMQGNDHNDYKLSKETQHIAWSTSKDIMLEQTKTLDKLRKHISSLIEKVVDAQSEEYELYYSQLKNLEKYEDALLRNIIVETIMDNLSSPDHIIEMSLPITTEHFVPLIKTLEIKLGWHNEIKEKYNPSIIRDILGLHSNIHGGDIITGAGANGFKELAYIFNTALDDKGEKELKALRNKSNARARARKRVAGIMKSYGETEITPESIQKAKEDISKQIETLKQEIVNDREYLDNILNRPLSGKRNEEQEREDEIDFLANEIDSKYKQIEEFKTYRITDENIEYTKGTESEEAMKTERLQDLKALNAIYKASNQRSLAHGNVPSSNRRTGLRFKQMPISISDSNGTISYGHITENGYWMENKKERFGLSIWEQLDAIINLALDNLKENKLGKLSISNDTFQAILGGLALGMPFQEENNLIGNLLYQPAIKMLTHSQYVGISDIHDRIGLKMIKKGQKDNMERAVAYEEAFKEDQANTIGDTLVKVLSVMDKEALELSRVENEASEGADFFDLSVYLSGTSSNAGIWEENAHKGYFKVMEAVLEVLNKTDNWDIQGWAGNGERTQDLVKKANGVLRTILTDKFTRAFDDTRLFDNDSFIIFLKQNLKALTVFKQLDILGADINTMNKPIAALRINPTDAVEVQETLSQNGIFGPTLTNIKPRYKRYMGFSEFKDKLDESDDRITTQSLSINPENFINKQPHIKGALLGAQSAQAMNARYMIIEDPSFKQMIEDTLEMLSEGKYNNIISVRADNHISEEARLILIKEELARFAIFNEYKDFMEAEESPYGKEIEFGSMKDNIGVILEAWKVKDKNVIIATENLILDAIRFDNRGKLRFRGSDILDKKNHQAYLMAAEDLSNMYFDQVSGKVLAGEERIKQEEKNWIDTKLSEPEKTRRRGLIIPLDLFLGIYLKLEQQGYGTEHKAYQLLSKDVRDLIADLAYTGMENLKDVIDSGTEQKEVDGIQGREFSEELTNLRQAFTESVLRRNLESVGDVYETATNGIKFVPSESKDMILFGGEQKARVDLSGFEKEVKINERGFFYDLKVVTDKEMPPYIKANGNLYVRLLSTYDEKAEISKKKDKQGKEIESKATEVKKNNTHFFVKLPRSTTFAKESFLSNRLDTSYLSIIPYQKQATTFAVRESLIKRLEASIKENKGIIFLYEKNDVSLSNPIPIKIKEGSTEQEITTSGKQKPIYRVYEYTTFPEIHTANYRKQLPMPIKSTHSLFLAGRALEEEDALRDSCDV